MITTLSSGVSTEWILLASSKLRTVKIFSRSCPSKNVAAAALKFKIQINFSLEGGEPE